MFRAIIIVVALSVSASAETLEPARFLSALRAVETGNQVHDGAHGERGPWQITADVWAMHMPGIGFAEARQEGPARACALKQIAWLVAQLQASHVDANPFNVALAWNAGLERVLASRAPMSSYDYAVRVQNLYLTQAASGCPISMRTSSGSKSGKPRAASRTILFQLRTL